MANRTYAQTVADNMAHMGTARAEWTAVTVTGMDDVDGRQMPRFEFPKGYATAPSLFHGQDNCCNLCGTDIKKVYWLQNDERKWLLPVGSECVTYFVPGATGDKLAKRAVHEANREFLREVQAARAALWKEFAHEGHQGYGRFKKAIPAHLPAYGLHRRLKEVLGNVTADETWQKNASSDAAISRWMKAKGALAQELVVEVHAVLEEVREPRNASIRL